MTHKATKCVLDLDCTPCPHEEAMLETFHEGDSEAGEAVRQARAVGITWPNIIALLVQFGPAFVSMIQAIIAALNTPVPEPAHAAEEDQETHSRKRKKSEDE